MVSREEWRPHLEVVDEELVERRVDVLIEEVELGDVDFDARGLHRNAHRLQRLLALVLDALRLDQLLLPRLRHDRYQLFRLLQLLAQLVLLLTALLFVLLRGALRTHDLHQLIGLGLRKMSRH